MEEIFIFISRLFVFDIFWIAQTEITSKFFQVQNWKT